MKRIDSTRRKRGVILWVTVGILILAGLALAMPVQALPGGTMVPSSFASAATKESIPVRPFTTVSASPTASLTLIAS